MKEFKGSKLDEIKVGTKVLIRNEFKSKKMEPDYERVGELVDKVSINSYEVK